MSYFKSSSHYRVWIDDAGIGYIRIIKRINFKTLVRVFEELHAEIKKNDDRKIHITLYISKSLYGEMSTNAKEFLEFCQSCVGIEFKLILIQM